MNNIHTKALSYAGALFLIILSILAVVSAVVLTRSQHSYNENTISVTGNAEVSATPDIARFSFTVSEVSDTPEQAQEIISEKVSNILTGIEDIGVEEQDITTNTYTINPKYEWVRVENNQEISPDGVAYFPGRDQRQVLIGYDVRQSVSVTLRSLDSAGDLLSLFAREEVENLYGPNFEIEHPDALEEEAREEAIAEAKEKAQRLAGNLGVKLGDVISFNEGSDGFFPVYARDEMEMSAVSGAKSSYAPEIPAGENTINSRVTITYTIK